jgi:hypothetical protein
MRAALIACVLPILAATHEAVARDDACGRISSTEGRDVEPFDAYLPAVESALSLPKEGVFSLLLRHMNDVVYPVTPDRGRDGGYGGFVTIENIPAGRYRILLSDEVWLDAVQENARLPMLAFSRDRDCPGVRQSVQFQVAGQPLTLQVSGAPERHINIAVRRIWDFQWQW